MAPSNYKLIDKPTIHHLSLYIVRCTITGSYPSYYLTNGIFVPPPTSRGKDSALWAGASVVPHLWANPLLSDSTSTRILLPALVRAFKQPVLEGAIIPIFFLSWNLQCALFNNWKTSPCSLWKGLPEQKDIGPPQSCTLGLWVSRAAWTPLLSKQAVIRSSTASN